MPREDAIRLVARVVEVMNARLCRVELSNGHRLLAYAGRQAALDALSAGSQLTVEISPFDFSKGRVIAVEAGR